MPPSGISVILLDIEGTTTPMAFVHETLFAFARTHMDGWWSAHAGTPDAAAIAEMLAADHRVDAGRTAVGLPPWRDGDEPERRQSVLAFARYLMDRDRKSPALKRLQGLIWEEGYQAGVLRGVVYDDVPPALQRWRSQGLAIAIYSSGSELAQRRLFESTPHGDLTPLIAGFFDTRVGAKVDADSYREIARRLDHMPDRILFVSDVVVELRAAAEAGCDTCLSVRPGNAPQAGAEGFRQAGSFDEILAGEPHA